MDLNQSKLTKDEWNSIETPVSNDEKQILKLISDGYGDVNVKYNNNLSLLSIVKIDYNEEIEAYLYVNYFEETIKKTIIKYEKRTGTTENIIELPVISQKTIKKMKKGDIIRLQNVESTVQRFREKILEFVQIDICKQMLESLGERTKIDISATKSHQKNYISCVYTLIQMKRATINHKNQYVQIVVDNCINHILQNIDTKDFIYQTPEIIERNADILKYEDRQLFNHQKQLFSILKRKPDQAKLVLYTAPTGTGKTLSPIGLTQQFKVIFVCVARHVGLALAKAAISVEKKIAFAFGCETASDIRLHNYAAIDFVRNKKSGAIAKIDNSVGNNVEMIICDVKSYLVAMRYMLAFNTEPEIITYWDEPTITMDYENHDLHQVIHENWIQNRISKVVLSCATLPKEEEICDTIMDFRARFENAEIFTIKSYDCRKTISLTNKNGYCVLPHLLFAEYSEIRQSVRHCEENKSLLRYFDLGEVVRFLKYVNDNDLVDEEYNIDSYFGTDIASISMDSVKTYYLEVLKHVFAESWPNIYDDLKTSQRPKFGKAGIQKSKSMDTTTNTGKGVNVLTRMASVSATSLGQGSVKGPGPGPGPVPPQPVNASKGILLTTEDAYTLTDGPTLFLVEDVEKIAKFYIQQSKIPEKVFTGLLEKMDKNLAVQREIDGLQRTMEDKLGKEIDKSKKMEREQFNGETHKVMNEIARLKEQFNNICLESLYVPNTKQHQQLWIPGNEIVENAFVPDIDENTVKDIMRLNIDNSMKMLLLMGIGVFANNPHVPYMEIMKRLAYNQQLYMIVGSSDYIYGTNYQFCHGFLGKDLTLMTQQKIIQSLGRIGRNNIQQEYSVRFRDDTMLAGLFLRPGENKEAQKMSVLFCE
jgi:hypothetical protein